MTLRTKMLPVAFCAFILPLNLVAQTATPKTKKAPPKADPQIEARRTMAVSMVTSLSEEARSFRDLVLRTRVQARSADLLWDSDAEGGRALFRRAWESAEAADDENAKRSDEERRALLRSRGTTVSRNQPSMRREVLRLAARRDRDLGEEFLAKLEEARKRDLEKAPVPDANTGGTRRINPDNPPADMTQRLTLARQLLDDGDIDRAVQFADSGLYPVNTLGINFLDTLREKNSALADQRYMSLLARAINDPVSDANTVSLLSSYVFHPYMYVTVNKEGNAHTRRWNDKNVPPDNLPPAIRNAFFKTAGTILLGPFGEPDLSSSGRLGTFVIISRVLQLFEKHGMMEQVPALRTRLALLTEETPERLRQPNDPLLTRGIVPEDPNKDRVQEALDRLPRAKNVDERDRIYFSAAMAAAGKDDARARELAEKIEDADTRKQLLAYLSFDAMREAIRAKNADEAIRLSKSMDLTNIQRSWGLAEAGGLLAKTEPLRATEVLDMAAEEAKRIDQSSPDRVRSLIAVVTHFQKVDPARAWSMMGDVIKAANALGEFTGEDGEMTLRVVFKGGGAMTNNFNVDTFDLSGLFTALAKDDFNRAVDLPKGFQSESPRSVAMLAIARAVLDKKK